MGGVPFFVGTATAVPIRVPRGFPCVNPGKPRNRHKSGVYVVMEESFTTTPLEGERSAEHERGAHAPPFKENLLF